MDPPILASGGGEGRRVKDSMALAAAATAPTTNAGKFPPPNNASHGPLVTDTNICFFTTILQILIYCYFHKSEIISTELT